MAANPGPFRFRHDAASWYDEPYARPGDSVAKKSKERWSAAEITTKAILSGFLILGAVATVWGGDVPWEWLRPFLTDLGPAFFTVGLLGLTVDIFLKRQIARDVFNAAFRYVLPDELKDEVLRIISYKFICTDSLLIVSIDPIGNGLVRVNIKIERTAKNITRHTESMPIGFAVDEWGFHNHTSGISKCAYEMGDGIWRDCGDDPSYSATKYALGKISKEPLRVKSGQIIRFVAEGWEIQRENGNFWMFNSAPAINPVIEVNIPAPFLHGCSFGVPGEKVLTSSIAAHYRLDGAQFPGQNVQIRWWKPTP